MSAVWLIPFVAAMIGGWLTYRFVSDRGPTIEVTFRTAEGLEAGKTRLKYRDLEMGVVDSLELAADLSHVIATIQMNRGTERFLSDRTRFWVVRASVTAGGVSGLGTLFSGAHIAMDPIDGEAPTWKYTGLESAPLVTSGDPGSRFILRSPTQGSLSAGSPVYFRQVKVGEVIRADLDASGNAVNIDVFIRRPHDERVRETTRFWNVSGVEMTLSAEGVRVNTESIVSILLGGVAFDNPDLQPGKQAEPGSTFYLYPSRSDFSVPSGRARKHYVLYFAGSVKGLAPGGAVEFRGIRIGSVISVNLEYDEAKSDFQIPVVIEIEPEQLSWSGDDNERADQRMKRLVRKGLRAQLKTTNLLTGQLAIGFDMYPDAPAARVREGGTYAELPTVPTPLEELATSLTRLVGRLERLPLEGLGKDLRLTLHDVRETFAGVRGLVDDVRGDVLPGATGAIREAEKTLSRLRDLVGPESTASREIRRLLVELGEAARSVRLLADHLERNPEDLLRGRQGE